LLYNFPHHTQTPISARTVARIAAEFPHVIGIKDSGKDRALSREYQRIASGFRVYLGDDRAGADIRDLGFAGIVTGAGGPVAELPVAIAAAVSAGEPGEARARQREFDRYTDARKRMTCGDIAFAKAAAAARLPGFPFHVRTPLLETSFAQREEIHTVMKAIVPRPSPH
jgi:4-hydroxy-tetrahydrodipicolinate synthase